MDKPQNTHNYILIYQTKATKLNLQNQVYQTKCFKCEEPNLPNQSYKTESTKSSVPSKQSILNVKNQIYQTISIQSNLKTKSIQPFLPNQM